LEPSTALFRVAHTHPWEPHPFPKFANRFDDPDHRSQTLYACSQRLGAFVECLAPFRPAALLPLSAVRGSTDHIPTGVVPRQWLESAFVGEALVHGEFADIYGADWISRLRNPLAGIVRAHGYQDLDASVLQQARHRAITQAASKEVRLAGMNGVYYRSRLGHDFENWASFEPFSIDPLASPKVISDHDPDLLKALSLLGIALEQRADPD
jgi:hypothetical protein